MSKIIPFEFGKKEMRVIEDGAGGFEVLAKDVVEGIGAGWNGAAAIAHVPAEWKGVRSVLTPGGRQEMATLFEPGVYFYLNRSDKPDALPMQKWVSGEVLPSIRKTGSYSMPKAAQPAETSGLPEFRRARALDLAVKTAEKILSHLPSLGERARQVVFAKIVNPVAGIEVLALPHVAETHHQAGAVGEMLGISGALVGRIANQHNLKTADHGEYRLNKSQHSAKQVEAFVYNQAGIEAIKHHLNADRARQAEKKTARRPRAAAPTPEPQGALL